MLAEHNEIVSKVFEKALPQEWRTHRFGLSQIKWQNFKGKVFWVTGAGSGFGRSIACGLSAAQASVILSGRRVEKLHETCEFMEALGIGIENTFCLPMDLSDLSDIESSVEQVRNQFQSLDGLINNAGQPPLGRSEFPLLEGTAEEWASIMNVNVRAPWYLSKLATELMIPTNAVRMLFVTSEAGWASNAGMGDYNLSKSSLNSLAHCLAQEVNVKYPDIDSQINVVVPGEAKTEMNLESTCDPFEIVSMVLFLLSQPKGGPNGQFFHRDGRHWGFGYTRPYPLPLEC